MANNRTNVDYIYKDPRKLTAASRDHMLQQKDAQGELIIAALNLRVNYDLNNGVVTVTDAEKLNGVNTSYHYPSIQQPIEDAVHIVVKSRLLLELQNLGDKRIAQVVTKHLHDAAHNLKSALTRPDVDLALKEVLQVCKPSASMTLFAKAQQTPVQKAVFAALTRPGLTINSHTVAKQILADVNALMAAKPKEELTR